MGPVSPLRARRRSRHGRGASPARGRALGLVTQSFSSGHALRRPRPAWLTTPSTPLAPPHEEEPRPHLRPTLGAGRSLRKRKGTRTTSDGRRRTRRRKGRPTNKMAPAAGAASAAAGGGLEAALAVAATAVVPRPGTESESMVAAAAAAAATVATAAGTRS